MGKGAPRILSASVHVPAMLVVEQFCLVGFCEFGSNSGGDGAHVAARPGDQATPTDRSQGGWLRLHAAQAVDVYATFPRACCLAFFGGLVCRSVGRGAGAVGSCWEGVALRLLGRTSATAVVPENSVYTFLLQWLHGWGLGTFGLGGTLEPSRVEPGTGSIATW